MRSINRLLVAILLLVLLSNKAMSQQMRLGNAPSGNTKSAVLELQSGNQGLLFSRLTDTVLINALNPPDGMVVFFAPTKQLLVRANGYWQSLASTTSIDTTNIPNFTQKVRSRFSAGTGIAYNSTTGIISNTGVISVNGNTGALTLDTGYISNFYQKVRGLFSATGPITLNNGQIGITQASATTNGYLSSTDWNNFNNKLASIDTSSISNFYLKVRSLSSAGPGITYNSTTGVIGNSGVLSLNGNTGALTMDTGYISNFYQKVRGLFGATGPITLTNGQIAIPQASSTTNGYLSSTDWNNFNNKLASIDTTSIPNFYLKVRSLHAAGPGITYNATTGVIGNSGVLSLNGNTGALTMDTGYIANFYQKVRGLFGATGPITLNNGQIAITQATSTTNGYLSSADWNTFNNKLASIDTTSIANFYLKVRSLHAAGPGITYNATTGVIGNSGVLSLNGNTGALTMDTGYISNFYLKVRGLFSAGSGISYNPTTGVITSTGGASNWVYNGNTVGSIRTLGTIDNYDLPFITNNTERMRISNTGNVAIGTSTFDGSNPEKLLVDAGTTSSFNVISGKGSINNYLQLNIQNRNSGNTASSDVVATADNGTESANFVNMGINSSGFSNTGIIGGANTAYLYSTGSDFVIGNATGNRNLEFFTGGTANNNERMRIDQFGRVGIGVTNAANPLVVKDTFEIRRTGSLSTILFSNTSGTGDFRIGGDGGDIFWQGGGSRNLQMGSYWTTILMGDRQSGTFPAFSAGTNNNTGVLIPAARDNSIPLAIQAASASATANLTEWRNSSGTAMSVVDDMGSIAIGTSTFDATNPERLLVEAGNTSSFNVISGKGSINNYLQLNIQNRNTGNTASSDVVATADNGTESVNFIDMGINSSGFSSSGILGGANNAYLYSTGNDFVLGNATSARNLRFFTGGSATTNERMRIDGTGLVGIGTTTPSTFMHIRSGVANDAGLRLENLTTASTATTGASVLGVDATGKVVKAKAPVYYSGTGVSATVDGITKIWVAEVPNVAGGVQTINIPSNVAFASVLSIQVTAKGGSSVTTAPIAIVTSNTTSQVVIRVLESQTTGILLGGTTEGLDVHNDTNTRIYIRVEGN